MEIVSVSLIDSDRLFVMVRVFERVNVSLIDNELVSENVKVSEYVSLLVGNDKEMVKLSDSDKVKDSDMVIDNDIESDSEYVSEILSVNVIVKEIVPVILAVGSDSDIVNDSVSLKLSDSLSVSVLPVTLNVFVRERVFDPVNESVNVTVCCYFFLFYFQTGLIR